MAKTALFIAYNFPPHGGSGVQRSTKFVKYLREFGWDVVVLTADEDAGVVRDDSLLEEIPSDTHIERVKAFTTGPIIEWTTKRRIRLLGVLLNAALSLPDYAIFWSKKARPAALRLVEEHNIDLIYSTSGPYSSHLLGKWLKRKTGLPWFADFRDPWSTRLAPPWVPGYKPVNRWLERSVYQFADRVCCVSKTWTEDLAAVDRRTPEKFTTISNGYDEAQFPELPPWPRREDTFTMLYTGTFHINRRPGAIVAAVDALIAAGDLDAKTTKVVFIGENVHLHVPQRSPFECHGYVKHSELGAFREQADCLLLILPTSAGAKGNHSGKLYEYIAANRPILGIVCPDGEAETLIHSTQTGIATQGSTSELKAAILKAKEMTGERAQWRPNWIEIQKSGRRHLTTKLVDEFENLLSQA